MLFAVVEVSYLIIFLLVDYNKHDQQTKIAAVSCIMVINVKKYFCTYLHYGFYYIYVKARYKHNTTIADVISQIKPPSFSVSLKYTIIVRHSYYYVFL